MFESLAGLICTFRGFFGAVLKVGLEDFRQFLEVIIHIVYPFHLHHVFLFFFFFFTSAIVSCRAGL